MSGKAIILSGRNLVATGPFNNTFKYVFPNGSVSFHDHEIGVQSVNIWTSWYNISTAQRNNTFTYYYPSGATFLRFDVTIADGGYTLTQLNQFLQFIMIANGTFLVNGGNNVYYMEFVRNPTGNYIEFIAYPVPTTLPPGYTNPGVALPAVSSTPYLYIPTSQPQVGLDASLFGELLPFPAGAYPYTADYPSAPTTPYVSTFLYPNTTTPRLPPTPDQTLTDNFSPVTSLNMNCSLLYNNLALPCTLLYSFAVAHEPINTLITNIPGSISYQPIKNGIYNDFDITFTDQDGEPVYIRDTNLDILLSIRKKPYA
jgi:hypothetical protein